MTPRVRQWVKRKYGGLEIDLWPCNHNLSREGVNLVYAEIRDWLVKSQNLSAHGSAGVTYTYVAGLHKADIEPALGALLAIVNDSRYWVPLRSV